MKLGDAFYQIFEEKLLVTEEQVITAITSPSKTELLENGIKLYYKNFNDDKFSNLLIASQFVNKEELFAFAYWIPEFICCQIKSPLEILKEFTSKFGCKIRIANSEGLFIEKSSQVIVGQLQSPFQIMEILENEEIPCESYLFFSENFQNDLNNVITYYSFCINNNLYFVWLYDISTINIKVPKGWYEYLEGITKSLNPHGKTKLSFLNPANNFEVNNNQELVINQDDFDERALEIPLIYNKPFTRAVNIISSLGESQKIAIVV